jgi:outer membrane protein assembly factor BamE (lipoprotein component of BamABCDE complex)
MDRKQKVEARRVTGFALVLCLTMLVGCGVIPMQGIGLNPFQAQGSDKLNPDTLSRLKLGETTKEDVLKLLGNPSHVQANDNQIGNVRERWMYSHMKMSTGINPVSFLPVVGSFAAAASAPAQPQFRSLMLGFDASGIMRELSGQNIGLPSQATATTATTQK